MHHQWQRLVPDGEIRAIVQAGRGSGLRLEVRGWDMGLAGRPREFGYWRGGTLAMEAIIESISGLAVTRVGGDVSGSSGTLSLR